MSLAGPTAVWRDALRDGRFLIQRSGDSGAFNFPPRVARAGHGDLSLVEAGGGGTVYAVTTIRVKPPAEPYNVVIIELDEGPRLMSSVLVAKGTDVAIGLRVQAFIDTSGEEPVLLFRPNDGPADH